ncbi:MAG: aldehyde dehydrogenase family protein [Chloroflexi bacterium]|nr:MAG: aldehyde dehydrogenase family protein [Chloroflexota bacterium]
MDHILVEGVCVSPDHYIGGERITSSATFEDISPIDETLMGSVAAGGPAEVEAAVVAAQKAFPAWAALGPQGRGQHLRRLADVIESHTEELAIVETRDNGSLFKTNRESMVNRSARNFRYFAEVAERLHGERNVDEYDESHCCRTEWFAGSIAHSTDTAPRT